MNHQLAWIGLSVPFWATGLIFFFAAFGCLMDKRQGENNWDLFGQFAVGMAISGAAFGLAGYFCS